MYRRVCRSTILGKTLYTYIAVIQATNIHRLQHVSGMSGSTIVLPLREPKTTTIKCSMCLIAHDESDFACATIIDSTRTRQLTLLCLFDNSVDLVDIPAARIAIVYGYTEGENTLDYRRKRTNFSLLSGMGTNLVPGLRQRHCSMWRVCRSTIGLYENKTTTLQHVSGMSINNRPLREQDNDTAACVGYVDQQSASTRTRQRHCSMCRVCRSTIGLYENKTTTLQHVSGMSINNQPLREQDNDTAACVGYVDQQSASTRTRQRHCSMCRECRSTIGLYENKTTTLQYVSGMSINNRSLQPPTHSPSINCS